MAEKIISNIDEKDNKNKIYKKIITFSMKIRTILNLTAKLTIEKHHKI